jgi:quercetin 2,3-dioxygenase
VEVGSDPVPEPQDLELTRARNARVGGVTVRRMVLLRVRQSAGAWCFIDHYGPMDVDGMAGMNVPPHPHIGLQTVTWLFAGNVLHRDSVGTEQLIRPGQLNLMTSGRGIAHAEESPAEHDPTLHGVQLWVALPNASRLVDPAFEHCTELPETSLGGFHVSVLLGDLAGLRSPATAFSRSSARSCQPLTSLPGVFSRCGPASSMSSSQPPGRAVSTRAAGTWSAAVPARGTARDGGVGAC